MQNDIPLLYDYIKSELDEKLVSISENVIVVLSNDISYKIHEIALLSRSIMLKSNRHFLKDEDIYCALKLSYKNLLFVLINGTKDEKLKDFSVNNADVVVKVSSHSVSPLNLYSKCNFRLESDVVFSRLLKNLLSNKRTIYEHSLKFIRNRNDLDDIIIMLLSSINVKIDDTYDEELFIRACTILYSVVQNKSISLSENPWRDLCMSIALKLLWSKINLRLKVAKVSMVLHYIISRQYLMVDVVRNMVIDVLLNDVDKSKNDVSHYSGSFIGLICLGYVVPETVENFVDKLNLHSPTIISATIMNETVYFLLYIMKSKNLLINVPYPKLFHLIDSFCCAESISLFINEICPHKPPLSPPRLTCPSNDPVLTTSHVISFGTVSNEINILLRGGCVDDLTPIADGMDDLPPVLFRKPYIQPPISHFAHSVNDIGFDVKIRSSVKLTFAIKGVDNSLPCNNNSAKSNEPFLSGFHSVFQRRRQFIENRTRMKINRNFPSKLKTSAKSGCIMETMFYAL